MKFDGILGLGRLKEAVVKNASFIHNLEYDVSSFSLIRRKQGISHSISVTAKMMTHKVN